MQLPYLFYSRFKFPAEVFEEIPRELPLSAIPSLCIRNDGPETLIVDSGLHYFVRIEPGRARKIQPENATYIEEQMLEMNENIDGMTAE